jgi:putative flippase GtrA
LHVVVIGIVANILAISMSFLTYKLFVFRTKGNWLKEYFRTYVVYGGTSVIGILLLWVFVDVFNSPFWIAQGLAIIVTVMITYIAHSRFTYKTDS